MHSREGEENDDKKANVRDDSDMIDYYICETVQFILNFFFTFLCQHTHILSTKSSVLYIVYIAKDIAIDYINFFPGLLCKEEEESTADARGRWLA